jgi:hypothetical protein
MTCPGPGEILLFGGAGSEPELLFPYGTCRFASEAGSLAGNPILTLDGPPSRLALIGQEILWGGAMELRIEMIPSNEAPRGDARTH